MSAVDMTNSNTKSKRSKITSGRTRTPHLSDQELVASTWRALRNKPDRQQWLLPCHVPRRVPTM